MCTTGDSGEIIILSDDDDDDDVECDEEDDEPSVLIVETGTVNKTDTVLPQTPLDEDLVVTFSRRAEVLPHARYDCPIHPFLATDNETNAPVATNYLICEQCFCYICDKLASECAVWCHSGCHCNSHKRSDFWNNIRKNLLLGVLHTFNLTLSEIDTHLRQAGKMLQNFKQELSVEFFTFLKGKPPQEYGLNLPNRGAVVYDYRPVYEFVSSFLNKADQQDGRAAAVMKLGAAEDFCQHFQFSGAFMLPYPMANVAEAKTALLQRVIVSVQRQMVMDDFTPVFTRKLQEFSKKFDLSMTNSLCVRHWDDVLLTSVLKGQNVLGFRKDKGKKDVLLEQISVVLLRAELLQRQRRYRELCRYLRVIKTNGTELGLQQVQDLIPFFMCMDGTLALAVQDLFVSQKGPACRLTPSLFLVYLRIFETATAPNVIVYYTAELCGSDVTWEPIKGAVPLKRAELVKFAFRAQRYSSAILTDSQCWTHLLTIVNSPCGSLTSLPPPHAQFLHEARDVVNSILLNQDSSSIQIPRFFDSVYPNQALLLLVTGALGLRILNAAVSPVLPVLNTFKENVWALEWLWNHLSCDTERLNSFVQEITQEMLNTTDRDKLVPYLRSRVATVCPANTNRDHSCRKSSNC
uniref:Zgc:112980 n=1 Tax=Mastacembelus armatus TaxID=205130 RepID=A0A3Q3LDB4_9TELE